MSRRDAENAAILIAHATEARAVVIREPTKAAQRLEARRFWAKFTRQGLGLAGRNDLVRLADYRARRRG